MNVHWVAPQIFFSFCFYDDEILQQKEWFSSYVFDPEASQLLKNEEMAAQLKAYVNADTSSRDNARSKLAFLYEQSTHYERNRHMIYPVFRIE